MPDLANSIWAEIENSVINAFDRNPPAVDCWGVSIDRHHVAEYCALHRTRFQHVARVATALLPPPGRVLEAGAAYGILLLALRASGYRVAGADMAASIASYGRPLIAAGVPPRVWDLHQDDWSAGDELYDIVLASEVLEHLQISLHRAVRRLATALAPNGWLVVTTPNLYRLESVVRIARDRNIAEPFADCAALREGVVVDARHHPREPTLTELKEAFQAAGLTQLRASYFDSFPHSARDRLLGRWLPRLRDTCLVAGRKPSGE
ncbi:MAG: class I SAM-dependent methyltransferase [Bryobacterales bacterium]|nr:class I SAM-dependent methyltransferase [Bryobacterales bacterium]